MIDSLPEECSFTARCFRFTSIFTVRSRAPSKQALKKSEARLTRLPKLYFEPDGSFVWARNKESNKSLACCTMPAGSFATAIFVATATWQRGVSCAGPSVATS